MENMQEIQTTEITKDPVKDETLEAQSKAEDGPERVEKKAESDRKTAVKAVESVGKSDQGKLMKDILSSYMEKHMVGGTDAEQALVDRMKTENLSATYIVEGMVEVALMNNPEMAQKFENREISTTQIAEELIGSAFDSALADAQALNLPEEERIMRTQQIEAVRTSLQSAAAQARGENAQNTVKEVTTEEKGN